MSKPLSEMIAEIDLDSADKIALRNHANELKQVAIELSRACEYIRYEAKENETRAMICAAHDAIINCKNYLD